MKRQHIIFKCVAVFLFTAFSSQACFNPADKWAAGVVWNDGERVDFSRLDTFVQGGLGISKTGGGDTVVYKYRSHYAPDKAMVRLDRYTPVAQNKISFPRIAIIADSAAAGASFDFSGALRAELDWLCCPSLGVLSMSLPERWQVKDSIKQGNSQYWTRQDRILPYNEWFTGDTLGGAYGTNGTKGGCGLDAAYDPPAHSLGLAPKDSFRIGLSIPDFSVINVRTNETRLVVAVRETSGQYYLPIMSRMPEFYDKLLTGYFDYDSLYGTWDSVFITLAIVGTVSVVEQGRTGFKVATLATKASAEHALLYNLRGCRVTRPAGVLLTKGNRRIRKLIIFSY